MKKLITFVVLLFAPLFAWSEVGDTFLCKVKLEDNPQGSAEMQFKVIDEVYNQCIIWAYNINDYGTHTALEDPNISGTVVIPEIATRVETYTDNEGEQHYKTTEYTVTQIGPFSFLDCVNLSGVIVPNTISIIDRFGFSGCSSLSKVEIPESVAKIGTSVFYDCTSLEDVILSNQIDTIPNSAFQGCSALKTINFPEELKCIEIDAFSGCVALESVEFNEKLISMKDYAFVGCEGLSTISFPKNSLSEIKIGAFNNCSSLTSVVIPNSVTNLESSVFEGCTSLTELDLGDGVKEIWWRLCKDCTSLKRVRVGKSIEVFEPDYDNYWSWSSPFDGCDALEEVIFDSEHEVSFPNDGGGLLSKFGPLKKVVIGPNVKKTSFSLCRDCAELSTVVFEGDVTEIGERSFQACKNLTSIEMPKTVKTIGLCAFSESGLKEITIPEGVTTICEQAFAGCENLEKVEIPSTVTTIGEWAFSMNPNLKTVVSNMLEPAEIDYGRFYYDTSIRYFTATLYIPEGTLGTYLTAGYWDLFEKIIDPLKLKKITIGKSGKLSFCDVYNLDFTSEPEVKAFIATGFDKTEGTIWMTRVKDVPAGVPVMIKGEAEKTYYIPVTDGGTSYYKNMFVGNTSGKSISIGETSEDGQYVNYYMSGGTFKSVSTSANIGNNKCYLQLPATFEAEATGEGCQVKIAASGKSSFAAPCDLDFTSLDDDVKAFTATGYDAGTKTIWLTRVKKVQKGEGLLLKGTGGETYTIPSSGVQAAYGNMIVGNIGDEITINGTSDDGTLTNYYLKGGTYVSVSGTANIGTNKSYLQLPTSMLAGTAGARSEDAPSSSNILGNLGIPSTCHLAELETESMPIIFAETTGIKDNNRETITNNRDGQWYTLGGQRIGSPTKKGLYIHNGKKVVIK